MEEKFFAICLLLTCPAFAQTESMAWKELRVGDQVYTEVTVSRVDEKGVGIIHSSGAASVPWDNFTQEEKVKLGLPNILRKRDEQIAAVAQTKKDLVDQLDSTKTKIKEGGVSLKEMQSLLGTAYKLSIRVNGGKEPDWQEFVISILGKPDSASSTARAVQGMGLIKSHNQNFPNFTWKRMIRNEITGQESSLTIDSDSNYMFWWEMQSNGEKVPLVLEP